MLSGHLAKIAYGCTHAARIGVVSVQDDSVTAGTDQLGTQVGRPVIFDSGLDIQGSMPKCIPMAEAAIALSKL